MQYLTGTQCRDTKIGLMLYLFSVPVISLQLQHFAPSADVSEHTDNTVKGAAVIVHCGNNSCSNGFQIMERQEWLNFGYFP